VLSKAIVIEMKLINRIQRDTYPLWEVVAAEPDFYEPSKIIRVKVKKPLPKDSHIKIKGNAINSDWVRILMPYYWIGRRKMIIREVNLDACDLLVKLKAKVRVPKLEEQHREDIRKQQLKAMSRFKQGR
jgi:hypothetical protein